MLANSIIAIHPYEGGIKGGIFSINKLLNNTDFTTPYPPF